MKAITAGVPVKPDFKRNHPLQFLLVFYLALWAALAISPLDRSDWRSYVDGLGCWSESFLPGNPRPLSMQVVTKLLGGQRRRRQRKASCSAFLATPGAFVLSCARTSAMVKVKFADHESGRIYKRRIEEATLNTKTLIIVAASILTACSNRTITMTVDQEKFKKAMRDDCVSNLATQMESINYPVSITHEGDTLTIRVGQSAIRDVRSAICRQTGWSSFDGKMEQIDKT